MSPLRARATPAHVQATIARRHLLSMVIGVALCGWGGHASATPAGDTADGAAASMDATVDASFDRTMLSGAGQNTTDLSRFERGNFTPSGNYRVDIFLNEHPIGRSDVRFAAPSPDASATPCMTGDLLALLGLHPADLTPQVTKDLSDPTACVDIATLIPGASMDFDMGDLQLDTSVPQAFLGQQARGYVDPKYWDAGVNAGLLNYNFNSYRTTSRGLAQTSSFLGLDAGVNVGGWHLRHQSSLVWQSAVAGSAASHHWQNIATYVQHDLPSLRAQLTLGDSWTSGEIFGSVGLRGVQFATDDRMLPQSLRGYAPTVRGVADSNAKVTIRQNGMVLYQTTVAPGPFAINDLYATGYGGDLEVSVTEASGRVHTFSVPYASVPQLLRQGVNRFSVVAGQMRDDSITDRPAMLQATWQRGFSNLLTGYAGINGSQGYASALLGGAFNTSYGAFAMDVTSARTHIPGLDTLSGQSVRLSYSKTLPQSGTTLSVAAYRYSTSGFLSLGDAERARSYARHNLPVFATGNASRPVIDGMPVSDLLTPAQQAALLGRDFQDYVTQRGVDRRRNDFSLTLSQTLGSRGGSLYVSGSVRNYWNRSGTDTQYQVGYNNMVGRLSYSVSASRESDLLGHSDNRYMLSLTLPLGSSQHAPVIIGSFARDTTGGAQQQATISGTAGDGNQFTYGATASHDSTASSGGAGGTASITGGYRGSHIQANAGFGHGSGYSQASLSVAGGVVAHPGGVTFGQPMGDTVAIVDAQNAAGAKLSNTPGLRVDRHGYALIPYLTPFEMNTITLDPTGLPLDVQLDSTSAQVAPHAGAVVMVKFKSESGRFVLIEARLADGGNLPFGAQVEDEQGQPVGVVGQAGRVMARVPALSGQLSVRWDDQGSPRMCVLPYQLPAHKRDARSDRQIEQLDLRCNAAQIKTPVARSGA